MSTRPTHLSASREPSEIDQAVAGAAGFTRERIDKPSHTWLVFSELLCAFTCRRSFGGVVRRRLDALMVGRSPVSGRALAHMHGCGRRAAIREMDRMALRQRVGDAFADQ